jgi:hypothetical protein
VAIQHLKAVMATIPPWNPKTPKEDATSRRLKKQKQQRRNEPVRETE